MPESGAAAPKEFHKLVYYIKDAATATATGGKVFEAIYFWSIRPAAPKDLYEPVYKRTGGVTAPCDKICDFESRKVVS